MATWAGRQQKLQVKDAYKITNMGERSNYWPELIFWYHMWAPQNSFLKPKIDLIDQIQLSFSYYTLLQFQCNWYAQNFKILGTIILWRQNINYNPIYEFILGGFVSIDHFNSLWKQVQNQGPYLMSLNCSQTQWVGTCLPKVSCSQSKAWKLDGAVLET